MTNDQAYAAGKETGARFDFDARQFDGAVRYEGGEYPRYCENPVLNLFWQAGLRGLDLPQWVQAVRIGKLPACGFSTNYREQHAEPGVSVLHIVGQDRKDNGTYDLFNAGIKINVEGWLHFRTGSDGEPILVGAVEIK
jgi:hypothetical protein